MKEGEALCLWRADLDYLVYLHYLQASDTALSRWVKIVDLEPDPATMSDHKIDHNAGNQR